MKTYNNLFDKIVDKDNIRKAVFKAARGKRNKASVRKALSKLDTVVNSLSESLSSGRWQPEHIHYAKEINDGVELKKRYIVCPRFVNEQCVHHAIMNICEPLFRRKFYHYSCGSVKGNGAEQAKGYIEKMIQNHPRQTKYAVKLDIRKFFHSVKPSFIFRELRRTIRDKRVLSLFALILRNNGQMIRGEYVKQGIPIGFFTSPHFANIVLNRLDHIVKEKCNVAVYVRYMDDMILFDGNRRRLKRICKVIESNVFGLKMKLKTVWQVHKLESICFLGYQFKRDRTKIRDRIFLKAKRLFKRVSAKVKMTIHDCLRVLSYIGRFKYGNTQKAFRKYVSGYLNVRILRKLVSSNCKERNYCYGLYNFRKCA